MKNDGQQCKVQMNSAPLFTRKNGFVHHSTERCFPFVKTPLKCFNRINACFLSSVVCQVSINSEYHYDITGRYQGLLGIPTESSVDLYCMANSELLQRFRLSRNRKSPLAIAARLKPPSELEDSFLRSQIRTQDKPFPVKGIRYPDKLCWLKTIIQCIIVTPPLLRLCLSYDDDRNSNIISSLKKVLNVYKEVSSATFDSPDSIAAKELERLSLSFRHKDSASSAKALITLLKEMGMRETAAKDGKFPPCHGVKLRSLGDALLHIEFTTMKAAEAFRDYHNKTNKKADELPKSPVVKKLPDVIILQSFWDTDNPNLRVMTKNRTTKSIYDLSSFLGQSNALYEVTAFHHSIPGHVSAFVKQSNGGWYNIDHGYVGRMCNEQMPFHREVTYLRRVPFDPNFDQQSNYIGSSISDQSKETISITKPYTTEHELFDRIQELAFPSGKSGLGEFLKYCIVGKGFNSSVLFLPSHEKGTNVALPLSDSKTGRFFMLIQRKQVKKWIKILGSNPADLVVIDKKGYGRICQDTKQPSEIMFTISKKTLEKLDEFWKGKYSDRDTHNAFVFLCNHPGPNGKPLRTIQGIGRGGEHRWRDFDDYAPVQPFDDYAPVQPFDGYAPVQPLWRWISKWRRNINI